jgi:hypothetical protein
VALTDEAISRLAGSLLEYAVREFEAATGERVYASALLLVTKDDAMAVIGATSGVRVGPHVRVRVEESLDALASALVVPGEEKLH